MPSRILYGSIVASHNLSHHCSHPPSSVNINVIILARVCERGVILLFFLIELIGAPASSSSEATEPVVVYPPAVGQ